MKQEVPTARLKDILASATVLAWRQLCSLSMSQCLRVTPSCSPAYNPCQEIPYQGHEALASRRPGHSQP